MLPTRRSIALGGVGENGGMTGRGGGVGEEEEEADGTVEDNGRGREVGVNEGIRSEETVGWSRGEEDTGVGERGGGRDGGEGLEVRGEETKRGAGLVEIGGEDLGTAERAGGRDKGVDGCRGGREGS